MSLTHLTSAAELLVATDHDAFVRSSLRHPMLTAWTGGGASAWRGVDQHDDVPYLMAVGKPAAVAALVTELLPDLTDGQSVTLPLGTARLLPAWVGLDGTDWDFRWLAAPPPVQAGEDRVVLVEDTDAIAGLLAASSPRASVQPGSPRVRRWLGVADGPGRLLACAADTSASTDIGHLSSIAVHPGARGQGLGRAVTAAMSRRLLGDGADLVTLGMYADNVAGRALYDGLGFADDHRLTSGQLLIRSRW